MRVAYLVGRRVVTFTTFLYCPVLKPSAYRNVNKSHKYLCLPP